MPKKPTADHTIPGKDTPTPISVGGLTPEQEREVQNLIGDMGPGARPNSLAFLPHDKYRNMINETVRTGRFLGQPIGRSGAADAEKFGSAGHSSIGAGISVVPMERTWLDAALLGNPKELRDVLGHELGHYAEKDPTSESGADEVRDQVYKPRAIAQQKLTQDVSNLPLRPLQTSALPSIQEPSALAPAVAPLAETAVPLRPTKMNTDNRMRY